MKHRLLIFLCALSLLAQEASAQMLVKKDKEPAKYKHEWRFGVAGYPIIEMLGYSDWGYHDIDIMRPGYTDIDRLYKDHHGSRRMIGLVSAEYSYNFHKHLTLAVGGYASTVWEKSYDYMGHRNGTNAGFSLSIVPTLRGKYLARDKFSMYSAVGLGVNVGYFKEWSVWPTFIIVPLGITFGDKVYGFAEFGAGLLYIGGAAGVGYRF